MVENYLEAVGMMTPAYDLLGQAGLNTAVGITDGEMTPLELTTL